jgi:hypothetical protein
MQALKSQYQTLKANVLAQLAQVMPKLLPGYVFFPGS